MKYLLIQISLFLLILKMNAQTCGSENITSRSECFANSTSEQYCCYFKEMKMCKLVNKTELNQNKSLDCGISDQNYGKYDFSQYHPEQEDLGVDLGLQTCGKNNPKKARDCTNYSQLQNSCCQFKVGGKSGCFFIGKKYLDKYEEKSFDFNSSLSIKYECHSINLMPKLFLLLAFLFFL